MMGISRNWSTSRLKVRNFPTQFNTQLYFMILHIIGVLFVLRNDAEDSMRDEVDRKFSDGSEGEVKSPQHFSIE